MLNMKHQTVKHDSVKPRHNNKLLLTLFQLRSTLLLHIIYILVLLPTVTSLGMDPVSVPSSGFLKIKRYTAYHHITALTFFLLEKCML